ncbi:MAG: hypothetical protein HZB86_04555 [Deltaproteobacteria bacterium]|nr:hypothetical protein [Deltaproteobacteria bacterium]
MDVVKRSQGGITRATLSAVAVAAAILHSCGGGGGGGGGATLPSEAPPRTFAGPGINSGLVAGKGSLIVNGVEFRAGVPGTVRIDGAAVAESAVRQGMVVRIRGAFGPLENEGGYDNVAAEPQVIGPVSGLSGSSFTVLGQAVTITPATIFDDPANRVLANGDVVEVHGIFSGANSIEATYIQRDPAGATKRQVRGVVGGSVAGSFFIGLQRVDLGAVTPVPLDNDFVEVEGTQAVPGGPLQATSIVVDNFPAHGDQEVETEGSVASHDAAAKSFVFRSPWGPVTVRYDVPGFAVTAFQLEERNTPSTASAVLSAGNQVEVEGRLVGGVLQAREIELRRTENAVLEGIVSSGGGSNFTLMPFGIALSAPAGQVPSNGDRVEVGGTVVPGTTSITVTRVTPLTAGTRVFIKGPVTSSDLATRSLTILGIPVNTSGLQPADDASLGLPSEYENAVNRRITRDEFYAQIVPLVTVVRAKAQDDPAAPPFTGGVFHPRAGVEIEPHR